MPILVRPVREQLEHDRVIRLLEAKYRRKFHVDINPGEERKAPVKSGPVTLFPDLILSDETGRKPYAVVEVETGESVNHLEAMSQWANLAKSKAHLYLYVPAGSVDSAKRLCADHQIVVTELTSYLSIGDQVRFTTVSRVATPDPVEKQPAEKRKAVEKASERVTEKKTAVDKDKSVPLPVERAVPADKLGRQAKPEKVSVERISKNGKLKLDKAERPDKVEKADKAENRQKKAPAPAKRPVAAPRGATPRGATSRPAAAAKRRQGETGHRGPHSEKRLPEKRSPEKRSVKRAAASRTAARAATKRTPARAVTSKVSKRARPQKRK